MPDIASQVRALEQDGYLLLPSVLSPDEVAALRDAMDRTPSIPGPDKVLTPERDGHLNREVNNAFNRDPLFLDYLDRPGIIDIAEAVHGADCHVIGMTAWLTGPGRPAQSLHVDFLPIALPEDVLADPRVCVPIYITTAHFYLDVVDEALGPTTFIRGSHMSGRAPAKGETSWKGRAEEPVLCRAGDVVIFRSDIWHRGTANRSTRTRYLLQVHYARRIISQKYPPYHIRFRFDPGILERATPRQLRLMGDHKRSNYG